MPHGAARHSGSIRISTYCGVQWKVLGVARRASPAASLGHRLSRYFRRARDDAGSLPSEAHQFSISRQFIRISSFLLLVGMVPLLVGICRDFYVVTALVLGNAWWSSLLTGGLAAVFVGLWYILPRLAWAR